MFSENVATFLIRHMGASAYMVLAYGLFFAGPVLLLTMLTFFGTDVRRGGRNGLLFGLGVATWASLCWLVVPYCGGYPSLPGLVLLTTVFDSSPVDTLPEELFVHAANFALWPMVGWLAFRAWRKPKCSAEQVT